MSEDGQRIIAVSAVLILIIVIVTGVLYGQKKKLDTSTLPVKSETHQASPQSPAPEPSVSSWREYTNPTYRFSMTVPSEWYEQDFSALHTGGGTLIAFSPDPLPCPNCSYIKNGYFSVRIFNEKTDPEYYTLYVNRLQMLGKNQSYQQVKIGDKTGLLAGNTIAVENGGWVYELSLDKDNGNAKLEGAELFQRIVNSISFGEKLL